MPVRRRRRRREGIVAGWLVQLVALVAVVGLIGFETIAITIAAINLDDDAREVAQAAAQAYGAREEVSAATQAAAAAAREAEVTLEDVSVRGGNLQVEVSQLAGTLVVHRIGPLEELARTSASGRAAWRR